jgi:hypothetical protein
MHRFFRGPICNEAYTLTFGDRAENQKGMEIIGNFAQKGLSVAELREIEVYLVTLGMECRLIPLGQLVPHQSTAEAAVLVIQNGVNGLLKDSKGEDAMYKELRSMPKDTTYLNSFGKVANKKARHNNTLADYDQAPDIPNGKGTVLNFKDYPTTGKLRDAIGELVSYSSLVGELNHYYDAEKCSIGWHGDEERKIAIGARFGYGANDFPLKFQWYMKGKPIGCEGKVELHAGDVYIMSEKAVGYDTWAKPWIPTLRHSAGKTTGTKRKASEEELGSKRL